MSVEKRLMTVMFSFSNNKQIYIYINIGSTCKKAVSWFYADITAGSKKTWNTRKQGLTVTFLAIYFLTMRCYKILHTGPLTTIFLILENVDGMKNMKEVQPYHKSVFL